MKYLKTFEDKQLDLFGGSYRIDVIKKIHEKIEQFIDNEKKNITNTFEKGLSEYLDENNARIDDFDANTITNFIKSGGFNEFYTEMFERFVDYINEAFKNSSLKFSKEKTDDDSSPVEIFNIKYKDLYKMYMEHDPNKIFEDYIIKYYKKLFNEEPTKYNELRDELPDWVKEEFPDMERSTKADLWGLKTN